MFGKFLGDNVELPLNVCSHDVSRVHLTGVLLKAKSFQFSRFLKLVVCDLKNKISFLRTDRLRF